MVGVGVKSVEWWSSRRVRFCFMERGGDGHAKPRAHNTKKPYMMVGTAETARVL